MQVNTGTKMLYGLGFASQGIKDGLFQVFLFIFYNQVLGLDPVLTGTATVVALVFDAISDPLVGVISDNWTSKKWGRRHPFMFLSALPLGITIWLLFLPPETLGQAGLFWWMTIFTILVRFSLTLFIVPAMSLGAEMSSDFEERTSITSIRITFGALISTMTIILGFILFFVPTEEYARGLENKNAYPAFALFCGILIIICVLMSTWGTRKEILKIQAANPIGRPPFSFQNFRETLEKMIQLKSFNSIVSFNMMVYIGLGVGTVFSTYFMEYYFRLSETKMIALPIASGLGGILALILAPRIGKKLGKKRTVIYSTFLFAVIFSLPYNFRILGIFPENGDPNLIKYYFLSVMGGYAFLWVAFSLVNSMMADVIDEYEMRFQKRDEGLFFAALSFAYKMTVGVGYFISGLLFKVIAFPSKKDVEVIPQEAIDGLGIIGGPILLGMYLFSILFITIYTIDKKRYEEIRAELDNR
ncbi:MAG: MFS transporter [Saprospiraceae bacterium]